jgi:hypothetical protein
MVGEFIEMAFACKKFGCKEKVLDIAVGMTEALRLDRRLISEED